MKVSTKNLYAERGRHHAKIHYAVMKDAVMKVSRKIDTQSYVWRPTVRARGPSTMFVCQRQGFDAADAEVSTLFPTLLKF